MSANIPPSTVRPPNHLHGVLSNRPPPSVPSSSVSIYTVRVSHKERLHSLLSDKDNFDLRIHGSDGFVKAHRLVFSFASPLLLEYLKEQEQAIIMVPDFKKSQIQIIVDFLYTGHALMENEDMLVIGNLGDILGITGTFMSVGERSTCSDTFHMASKVFGSVPIKQKSQENCIVLDDSDDDLQVVEQMTSSNVTTGGVKSTTALSTLLLSPSISNNGISPGMTNVSPVTPVLQPGKIDSKVASVLPSALHVHSNILPVASNSTSAAPKSSTMPIHYQRQLQQTTPYSRPRTLSRSSGSSEKSTTTSTLALGRSQNIAVRNPLPAYNGQIPINNPQVPQPIMHNQTGVTNPYLRVREEQIQRQESFLRAGTIKSTQIVKERTVVTTQRYHPALPQQSLRRSLNMNLHEDVMVESVVSPKPKISCMMTTPTSSGQSVINTSPNPTDGPEVEPLRAQEQQWLEQVLEMCLKSASMSDSQVLSDDFIVYVATMMSRPVHYVKQSLSVMAQKIKQRNQQN